ncbi:hypothetical protein [Luteimonas sp. MHLX1A]|uniref:hypothetical protein n=1 Tax=Alterluteimonas muca TaxID=2878684 RepID=UPI001E336684|nr:hypothetical protein [Luteimonas sp. MHLX1A]MCD9046815.1 hypothetical protein [Luteimonas sp. MHLX1A]
MNRPTKYKARRPCRERCWRPNVWPMSRAVEQYLARQAAHAAKAVQAAAAPAMAG